MAGAARRSRRGRTGRSTRSEQSTRIGCMTERESSAVLAIAIHAAFADGAPADMEREQIRRVADGMAGGGVPGLPSAYQAVLVEKRTVEDAAAALTTPESRRFAYEMAVAVAESDGVRTEAERAFLDHLRELLGVDAAPAAELERQTQALLTTPVAAPASPQKPDAGRPRRQDPERRHPERRARAASRVARHHGHHPAADEARVRGGAGARVRARSRTRHRAPRHGGRRGHRPGGRAGGPQAPGRDPRGHRRPHARRAGAAGGQLRRRLRHHLRPRAGRPPVLRQRAAHRRRPAEGGLPAHARGGARDGRPATPARSPRRRGPSTSRAWPPS